MAQAQRPADEGGAEFVRRIVTDPNNVPNVMRLYGYPGASSEENHERLYLSPDLSTYVEVPTNAILHRMAVPPEQDPHGAVTLWVRRDAALVYKATPGAQALAQFFHGPIAAATRAAAGAAAAPPPPVVGGGGWPYTQNCTFQTPTCAPLMCQTVAPHCWGSVACPSAACAVAPIAGGGGWPYTQNCSVYCNPNTGYALCHPTSPVGCGAAAAPQPWLMSRTQYGYDCTMAWNCP